VQFDVITSWTIKHTKNEIVLNPFMNVRMSKVI